MICLESPSRDPYFNLAMEEYVFSHLDHDEQYLMLWQNSNTIVVGKYQNTAEEINQAYVDAHGVRVARRLSGGGAVYHDDGNLNYTLIVKQENLEEFNFRAFVRPVLRVLDGFGIHGEFNGRNDLLINGKKFSGSSQYAKEGRLMHHGCIMLDSNLAAVTNALRVKDAKFQSKSVKSVSSRVTTINANTKHPITMEEFKTALIHEVSADQEVHFYHLTPEDLTHIKRLRDEKYATWEWNYGVFGNYEMQREKKFPSGLVTVSMNVQGGCIQKIRFSGDFFGNGEIEDLEKALVNTALDPLLETKLEQLNVSYYMNGITAKDLYELINH